MNVEPRHRDAVDVVRLVGGYVDGAQPVPTHIKLAVSRARAIDWTLAQLRLAKPVALVSGFWRSGTTWLQECLAESIGAKTVFEPLSPLDAGRRAQITDQFSGDEDALQALIPADCPVHDPLWVVLESAFTGRHGSNFLLSCRRNVSESFRRKIVVKDVRLQFNLSAAHRRFRIPVIHIRRHPCAVVASLLAADWHWSFERVRLAQLVPQSTALILQEFDTDALSRIAAYWALTERHVACALQDQPWAQIVTYEDMVHNPSTMIADLCQWVGQRQVRTASFGRPSASIHPDDFAVSSRRHDRWRRSLSKAHVAQVEKIVDHLHPAWREA